MRTCPYCAEQIQDEAKVCKHCGKDFVKDAAAKQGGKILGFGCLGMIGLVVVLSLIGRSSSQWGLSKAQEDAWYACRQFVTARLKAPATAKFPLPDNPGISVTELDNHEFLVRGFVDSQNAFGALVRTTYRCQTTGKLLTDITIDQ